MSAKVTVIAAREVGPVLGAVTSVGSEAKLEVDEVVGGNGFPLRNGTQVTLEVPPAELETFLATGDGPLLDPRAHVVVGGVPLPTTKAIKTDATFQLKPTSITFAPNPAPSAEVKAKAVVRRRSDDSVEVFPVAPIPAAGPYTYGVTLRANELYDVLLLVEGYPAVLKENEKAVP